MLSLVITGRNDGYGIDFDGRFLRALQFNARELTARAIPHEFVFVEWAPLADRPLLLDVVQQSGVVIDPRTLRWIVVDPRYQTAVLQNPRLRYLEFFAKNVGIRRAAGDFILSTNSDVILGRHVLDVLQAGALAPRTIYRAQRYDLKMALDVTGIDWSLLEEPANLELKAKPLKPPLMSGGAGDFMLLDRQSFHDVRGFNEVYRLVRFGIDRNFLVKALSSGLAIVDIGGPVYHFNHADSYRSSRDLWAGKSDAPWGHKRWHSQGVVYDNAESWGLRDAPSRQSDRCTFLDFSWDAVPPLVDLRRVVLPVSRSGGPTPGRYVAQS